jgi:hypothetical protein
MDCRVLVCCWALWFLSLSAALPLGCFPPLCCFVASCDWWLAPFRVTALIGSACYFFIWFYPPSYWPAASALFLAYFFGYSWYDLCQHVDRTGCYSIPSF